MFSPISPRVGHLLIVLATLTTSNSKSSFAPFVHTGRILRPNSIVKLHFHWNMHAFHTACNNLVKLSSELNQTNYDPNLISWTTSANNIIEQLCSHSPFYLNQKKQRSILLGIGIGALASYAIQSIFPHHDKQSSINDHNIKHLDNEIANLQKFVAKTAHALKAQSMLQQKSTLVLQLHDQISLSYNIIQNHLRGVISCMQGNLSPDIIPIQQAESIIYSLKSSAAKSNARLPFDDIMSLYTFPLSHTIENNVLLFSLPIPLIDSEYSIWELMSVPLFIDHPSYPAFISPKPEHSMLAIKEYSNPIPLSAIDLKHCTKFFNDYFCTFIPEKRKTDSCLASLFQDPEHATATCDFSLTKFNSFSLTNLNNYQYILSLNISKLSFETKCPNGSTYGFYHLGQTHITTAPHCHTITRLFTLPSFTTIHKTIKIRPFTPIPKHLPLQPQQFPFLDNDFSLLQHKTLLNAPQPKDYATHLLTLTAAIVSSCVIFFFAALALRYIFKYRQAGQAAAN